MSGKWFYADELQWDRVSAALWRSSERGDHAGLDTEFCGVGDKGVFDVRKESCAGGRTRVHMWSVAIKRWPHTLSARGYHICDTAVLLAPSLEHPGIRAWLESDAPKVCHNLSVDQHALLGTGVVLGGARNTLARARWVWPERARGAGYSLDALGWDILGCGKAESFTELFSEEVEEHVRTKEREIRTCSCGELKCRKRKGHEKTVTIVQEAIFKKVKRRVPLESVVPGHVLWERAVAYAARDAWLASAIEDRIEREMLKEVPWPWQSGRSVQLMGA